MHEEKKTKWCEPIRARCDEMICDLSCRVARRGKGKGLSKCCEIATGMNVILPYVWRTTVNKNASINECFTCFTMCQFEFDLTSIVVWLKGAEIWYISVVANAWINMLRLTPAWKGFSVYKLWLMPSHHTRGLTTEPMRGGCWCFVTWERIKQNGRNVAWNVTLLSTNTDDEHIYWKNMDNTIYKLAPLKIGITVWPGSVEECLLQHEERYLQDGTSPLVPSANLLLDWCGGPYHDTLTAGCRLLTDFWLLWFITIWFRQPPGRLVFLPNTEMWIGRWRAFSAIFWMARLTRPRLCGWCKLDSGWTTFTFSKPINYGLFW